MLQLFQSFSLVPPELRGWFYLAGTAAVLLAVFGSADRMRIWGLGRPDKRGRLAGAGLGRLVWLSATKLFSLDCLLARRVFARSRWRGAMVVAVIWSSIALAAASGLSVIFYILNRSIPAALTGLADPVLDAAGLLLLLGLLAALARRYLFPPKRWISVSADGALLIVFALSVLSGLWMEGTRLVGSEAAALARWPVGVGFAAALRLLNPDATFWARWYPALYLTHAGAGLALIAYLPSSKLFHVFASQITAFAARPQAPASPAGRELEAEHEPAH